jgi:hypothetical protein
MVFCEETPWFRYFASSKHAEAKQADPWEDVDADKRERERAFDIADLMEQGLTKEVSSEFVHPLRRSSKLWRFHVLRSEDKLEYRLYSEEGEFLLFAKTLPQERRVEIFLYNPSEDKAPLYDPRRPAFSMTYNETRTQWRLFKEQCELCQYRSRCRSCDFHGKQQLAHIDQTREPIGDGIFNCMEILIPGLFNDGSRLVWCPAEGYTDLALAEEDSYEALGLMTKRPEWNEEVDSLVLDFKNRSVVASAKNFQLSLKQKPDQVFCQYGKIGPSSFALDFRFPLSVVQAFAMALSTMFWT